MVRSSVSLCLSAILSVLLLNAVPAYAEALSTEQLIQRLEQLQSQLTRLEAKVQQLEASQKDAGEKVTAAESDEASAVIFEEPAIESEAPAILEDAKEISADETIVINDAAQNVESEEVAVAENAPAVAVADREIAAADEASTPAIDGTDQGAIADAPDAEVEITAATDGPAVSVDGAIVAVSATTQPTVAAVDTGDQNLDEDATTSDPVVNVNAQTAQASGSEL